MLEPGDWVRYSNKFLREVKPAGAGFHQHMMLVLQAGEPKYDYRRGLTVYLGRILSCSGDGKETKINDINLSLVHKGKHLVKYPPKLKVGDLVIPSKYVSLSSGPEFVDLMQPLVGRVLEVTELYYDEKDRVKAGGWWWPVSALVRQEKKKHEVSKAARENYRAPWAR